MVPHGVAHRANRRRRERQIPGNSGGTWLSNIQSLPRSGLNLYGDFEVKLFVVLSVPFVWHVCGLMAGSRVRTVGAFSAPSGAAWRLESVPVWLREKGREALLFAARIEARGVPETKCVGTTAAL
jgi:hypothetical protein